MIAGDIEYSVAGQGTPIIFLHGIGGNMASFSDQLSALPGFAKFAWNMPGYGRSKPGVLPPDFKTLSSVLRKFCVDLDLPSAHLVGHSIGGMLAIEHAIREPQDVLSITLIGTTPSFGGRDNSFREAFLKARLAPLDRGETMAGMARQAAPGLVGPLANKSLISSIQEQLSEVDEKTWARHTGMSGDIQSTRRLRRYPDTVLCHLREP